MIQKDEITVCDLCGNQIWFSEGTIYYINDEPQLLCPDCQKKQEKPLKQTDKYERREG